MSPVLPQRRQNMGSVSTFKHPFPEDGSISVKRIRSIIKENWFLNRTAVNEATDRCTENLLKALDGKARIIESRAGSECLSWTIPLNWKVNKAQIKDVKGNVLVDYADNPLHLWTNSVPFEGRIKIQDLIDNHIYTDPNRPNEFMYHYKNGYRPDSEEWGFSVPFNTLKGMADPEYEIIIDTELNTDNTLKIVDAFLPGKNKETIFFLAHTCHPAIVSDGIGCIAVAIELYHQLKTIKDRQYSYRFIFGPEYFGAATYLHHANKKDVANLHAGVFIDMITSHETIGFQNSMQGNARIDAIAKNVMTSHAAAPLHRPYRELWGNDETFYNGPGFEIPVIGVGRAMHREYHFNTDNLENLNDYHCVESVWILKRMMEVFETDFIPVRKYKGPLYLSRYGLYIDPTVDRRAAKNLERLQVMIDGERSCMDIADELDIDFFFVRDLCESMAEKGVVEKRRRPVKDADTGFIRGPSKVVKE